MPSRRSPVLYWAAAVAGFGVAVVFVGKSQPGSGYGPFVPFVFFMSVGIAALMAITHWICVRKGWR